MKIYNTLSRKIEEFSPQNPPKVGMYTCGPTVYDRMHIGNLRTFLLGDILFRALKSQGYDVIAIQNITDIDDKIIKRAKETKTTIDDVANKFTDFFIQDVDKLNINLVKGRQPKATQYVNKMIAYITDLINKGFAYVEKDGSVYFDISKFPNYGKLSGVGDRELKTGTRTLSDDYSKDDVQDFALWKATPNETFSFDSPWGKGRPGWHIECSVMSQESLTHIDWNSKGTFDIHVGGVDLIFPHHENEIAQSEAKTGEKFVNFFVHGEHMLIDGKKMSKSLNNFYTLDDLQKKGIDPMALRLLFLQTHYRQQMNFTWESAQAAQEAYNKLKDYVILLRQTPTGQFRPSRSEFGQKFKAAISNDLQIPQAMAVVWEMLKSDIQPSEKLNLLLEFDQVLGLNLSEVKEIKVPEDVKKLLDEREEARKNKDFAKSDELRKKIQEKGYAIEDLPTGYKIKKF